MKSPSSVSIIVPNFNHGPFLTNRLESILQQTYRNFQLIFIDDCSNDNSREILKKYQTHPKLSVFKFNHKNSGNPFLQWKKGIDLCQGDYIWIAESDDYADPTFLGKAVAHLDRNPSIGIVTCFFEVVNESETPLFNTKDWLPFINLESGEPFIENGRQFLINRMLAQNYIFNASGVVFRKSLIEHISNDFIHFKQAGDVRFWVDILLQSDICFIKETLNYWRIHSNSVTGINKSTPIAIQEQYRILKYILSIVRNTPDYMPEKEKQAFHDLLSRWWFEKAANKQKLISHGDIKVFFIAIKTDPYFIPRVIKFLSKKTITRIKRSFHNLIASLIPRKWF